MNLGRSLPCTQHELRIKVNALVRSPFTHKTNCTFPKLNCFTRCVPCLCMVTDRGRTLGTMCTSEEIERATHACRVSKLGPVERWWTQDGELGITIQEPPPRVRKTDTFFIFLTYSYCILSRVCKLATSLLVFCHCDRKQAAKWQVF